MKRIGFLLFGIGLFFGCVTAEKAVFRETADKNVLDLGSSRVYIDKRFVMVGDLRGQASAENIDDKRGTDFRSTRHLLVDATDGKDSIRRALIVRDLEIADPRHYFMGEANFDNYKGNFLDKGIAEKIGIRCAYLIQNVSSISKDIVDLAASKGFFIDKGQRSAVGITFTKNMGGSRNVQIIYVEAGEASQAKAVFDNAVHFIRFEM